VQVLLGTVLTVSCLYFGEPVLMPLAMAGLLSFLLRPAILMLERRHLPRVVSVIVVTLVILVVTAGVGWIVTSQFHQLALNLDAYKGHVREKLRDLRTNRADALGNIFEIVGEISSAVQPEPETAPGSSQEEEPAPDNALTERSEQSSENAPAASPVTPTEPIPVRVVPNGTTPGEAITAIWRSVSSPLATAAVVIVLVIFIEINFEELRNRLIRLAGKSKLTLTTKTLDEVGRRISSYLTMNALINGTFGTLVFLGLLLLGVDYAALWGFLAATLRFVPYVGPITACVAPILMAFLQFPGWWNPALVAGLFLVLELVTNNVLEPLAYGRSAGVSTVALLVAATFWTWVWGPVGLVLSVPLTVVLAVIGKHVPQFEALGILLGDEPALDPQVSFYQRLLAGDVDEATALFETQLDDHERVHVYDRLLIPALSFSEADQLRGSLSSIEREEIFSNVQELLDEHGPEEEQQPESQAPVPRIVLVGCPAQDEGDELTLTMLEHIVPAACAMTTLSKKLMASEKVARAGQLEADTVLISSVGGRGARYVNYLCKRFRQEYPHLRIFVGRWGYRGDSTRLLTLLRRRGADDVFTTLAEAQRALDKLPAPSLPKRAG
jgi:predicted PurR-regulated permease PerM